MESEKESSKLDSIQKLSPDQVLSTIDGLPERP